MTVLLICIFALLLTLALGLWLKPRHHNSGGHMIDASWLDQSERFKLVTRWGAQL